MRGVGVAVATYALLVLFYLGYPAGTFPPIRIATLVVAVLGVAGGVALLARRPRGKLPAAVFAGSMIVLGAFLFARRVGFVLEHGGMDSSNEPGSPAAFLIGWVFEQIMVTLPAVFLTVALWRVGARTSRRIAA
jgi:hypothetical protein